MNSAIAATLGSNNPIPPEAPLSGNTRQPVPRQLSPRSAPVGSVTPLPVVSADPHAPPIRPNLGERAEVHRVAGHVARGALEVLAGSRQAQQLASMLVPSIYRNLLARAELSKRARELDQAKFARLHQGVKTHSVHSCAVAPGIYELSVVVAERIRCRALAMRIEKQGGNWKVTALLIG